MTTIIQLFLFFNVTVYAGTLSVSVDRLTAIEEGLTAQAKYNDQSLVNLSTHILASKLDEQRLHASKEKSIGYSQVATDTRLLISEVGTTR